MACTYVRYTRLFIRSFVLSKVELEAIAQHGKGSPMRVTWIGHATLLVQVRDTKECVPNLNCYSIY